MALIAFTNTAANLYKVDVDTGERENTYAKFNFTASQVLYIDEADINPYAGDNVMAKGLVNGLKSGGLTITESALDDLTRLDVKNFLASGLGIHYYYVNSTVTNKYIVKLGTNGKIAYDSALGASANLGVARQDGTADQYVRVLTDGTATVVAGETLVAGDKVAGFTDGTAKKVTDVGKYYVGIVTVGNTVGLDATITVAPGVIS